MNSHFWLIYIPKGIFQILFAVGIGCYAGAILECRNWTHTVSFLAKPFLKFGRLPYVSGTAFLTAFFSNSAASSMLAGAYNDKKISRHEMMLSAIVNSFPAKLSHMLRVMFIILPLVGSPVLIYFLIIFTTGLIRTVLVLFFARANKSPENYDMTILEKKAPLSWSKTFKRANKRTKKILIKVMWMTVPIYISVVCLTKTGFFQILKDYTPEMWAKYFPPEVITIMAAKAGGLISAASITSDMIKNASITTPQILFAFFAGNLLDIPIRGLRRNLPVAMGIFPNKDGLYIVLILQLLRLIFTIIVLVLITLFI